MPSKETSLYRLTLRVKEPTHRFVIHGAIRSPYSHTELYLSHAVFDCTLEEARDILEGTYVVYANGRTVPLGLSEGELLGEHTNLHLEVSVRPSPKTLAVKRGAGCLLTS